jgi:CHASE3 domain sensor protein
MSEQEANGTRLDWRTEDRGIFFHLGRLVSRYPLAVGLVIVALISGASLWAKAKREEAERLHIAEEAQRLAQGEARRAQLLKEEADHRAQCTTGIQNVISEARLAIKTDPDRALAIMNACGDLIEDPRGKAMHKEALQAAQAVGAREAARVVAEEKRQRQAELARRKREGVRIGMTQEEVLQSNWGRPESVNRTVTSRGTREQWVYPGMRNYLYFEDGVLTTIQN